MRTTTKRAAGIVAGLALSFGALGAPAVATAAESRPEACAQQQTQLDKADAALERVTAVFERQKSKVKKAKHEVAAADTARERGEAKRDLARVESARDHAKQDKTAQQKRVEKAQARLDACKAEQPAAG